MTVSETVRQRAEAARSAAQALLLVSGEQRNRGLKEMAAALQAHKATIFSANESELKRAEEENLGAPLVKRLRFDEKKLAQAGRGIETVAGLSDPIGTTTVHRELDTGLILKRITQPIGVIAMIFESRPDALVQIASLALKSGNALMLKGGSEAAESNRALAQIISDATEKVGLPKGWLQLIETRSDVTEMLKLDQYLDLVIPRGSNEFVRYIMDNTRVPVLGHADGVCHVYVDREADPEKTRRVVLDSKTQYVAVCNAMETLLIDQEAAPALLSGLAKALQDAGVTLKGCERTRQIVPELEPATEQDWKTEYLDLVLSVRIVQGLDEAMEHINTYGSHHTDAIVTESAEAAERFTIGVDSASVMWNASTRFADGFRYGLGAEVGIATGKIHARGPVGIEGLVTDKWVLSGDGHMVADYDGGGGRSYTHRDLPLP